MVMNEIVGTINIDLRFYAKNGKQAFPGIFEILIFTILRWKGSVRGWGWNTRDDREADVMRHFPVRVFANDLFREQVGEKISFVFLLVL